jgi:hypothetical protein
MRAVDLDPSPNPRATLAEALHTPGPCLIHATIDPKRIRLPDGAAGRRQLRDDRLSQERNDVRTERQPFRVHPRCARNHGFNKVVLELGVANHPGVMSHICNLFARRAFNVEGILCMPVGGGETSRIWLLVFEDSASRR